MQHSFDISIAQKYGVNVAIFLNNIAFWIQKNVANKSHYHDEHHWTYNTQEAYIALFPYWTRQNLRTVLKKVIDEKLIITGNYNKTKYDRKTWYAFTEKGLDLFPTLKTLGCNQPIEMMEPTQRLVRTNRPIADVNTDIKTDRPRALKKRAPLSDDFIPNEKLIEEAHRVSGKVGLTYEQILTKFKNKKKSQGLLSQDWNAEFENWLISERPSNIKNLDSFKKVNEIRSTVPWFNDNH